jgi:transketolase
MEGRGASMADRLQEGLSGGDALDVLAIGALRTLAIDAVEKANSGHPGMPLGAAPMAHVLWTRHLKFDPVVPEWPDRDRFVLSAGHGSMLLYGLLHLAGYGLGIEDLRDFRQWGSRTPGHPEHGLTPGVEATTGPLGAGISNSVGLAIAEAFLGATFNRPGHRLVDHFTYGIMGDGCLMEGVAAEAASVAGHLGLGKLIYLYDDNHVTIEGGTDLAFTEDVDKRFEAYGWQVMVVEDGNDLGAVDRAIAAARAETGKPSLIRVRTVIGYGSPNKAGTAECHGAPLGKEEARLTKEALGWPADTSFLVPQEARGPYAKAAAAGAKARAEWEESFAGYERAHPDLALRWREAMAGKLPEGWQKRLPAFTAGESVATRAASGRVLNALAGLVPTLLGGSADLAPSTNTYLAGLGDFQAGSRAGRNLRFGVREHAMGGILNGLAYHRGLFPFGGTFFVFSDYMRPAVRLAALSGLPVTYVFTHDSVALGEDGPTHQPIEHLASLRAMPGLTVIRPTDATETVVAWQVALERRDGPTALVLTRQALPVLDRSRLASADGLRRGGYSLLEPVEGRTEAVIIASGSEVHVALEAAASLTTQGVATRVVALPSWELFEAQDASYKESVLPKALRARVAIEAGATLGWERYVGEDGLVIGLDHFGASAPASVLYEQFGLTSANVVAGVLRLLSREVGKAGE